MLTFRTEIKKVETAPFRLSYETPIMGIGSCFIEHIGAKLAERQLPVCINPFGIVYNPLSMAQELGYLLSGKTIAESDLCEIQGLWHSWQHHGRFSGEDKQAVLKHIQESLSAAQYFFKTTHRLVLTFGTARVFYLKKTGEVVANCHKAPPQYFEQKRLNVAEIVDSLAPIFEQMSREKPDAHILLTVSPIRHIRDGLIENNRSKAALLLACADLEAAYPNVHYFPAYEMVMDDLRDYRFYDRDMIHPSAQAIDYIWDIFSQTFFEAKTQEIINAVEKINQMRAHRPLHGTQTEGYRAFQKNLEDKISALEKQFPFLRFQ
jgi:hypothetical protein